MRCRKRVQMFCVLPRSGTGVWCVWCQRCCSQQCVCLGAALTRACVCACMRAQACILPTSQHKKGWCCSCVSKHLSPFLLPCSFRRQPCPLRSSPAPTVCVGQINCQCAQPMLRVTLCACFRRQLGLVVQFGSLCALCAHTQPSHHSCDQTLVLRRQSRNAFETCFRFGVLADFRRAVQQVGPLAHPFPLPACTQMAWTCLHNAPDVLCGDVCWLVPHCATCTCAMRTTTRQVRDRWV